MRESPRKLNSHLLRKNAYNMYSEQTCCAVAARRTLALYSSSPISEILALILHCAYIIMKYVRDEKPVHLKKIALFLCITMRISVLISQI